MAVAKGSFASQSLEWLLNYRQVLDDAIVATTLGKSVTIAGRTVSRNDLEDLLAIRAEVGRELDDREDKDPADGLGVTVANFANSGL